MEAAISCKFHCMRLAGHWQGYWPATDPADLAADIAERLAAATAKWSLEGIEPLDGGVVALTCAAVQRGRRVVLKLNPRGHFDDAQLAGEGDALAFRSPTGAAAQPQTGATKASPCSWSASSQATRSRPPCQTSKPALPRSAGSWHGSTRPAGRRAPSSTCATSLRPGRSRDRDDEEVLTHLDLHVGNALRTHQGWKAIDPKGVRADRHADVWALIDPLTLEDFPRDRGQAEATAARRLELYAEAAEMDLAEAGEWTRIRANAEASEVEDPAWAAALAGWRTRSADQGRR